MYQFHDLKLTKDILYPNCSVFIQAKVVEECDQIFGSSDRAATMNDMGQMKYLECCIKESLRLYPPVHFIMRKVSENLKLSESDYCFVLINYYLPILLINLLVFDIQHSFVVGTSLI